VCNQKKVGKLSYGGVRQSINTNIILFLDFVMSVVCVSFFKFVVFCDFFSHSK